MTLPCSIVGIDPGTTHSAYCVLRPDWSGEGRGDVEDFGIEENADLLAGLRTVCHFIGGTRLYMVDELACEWVQAMGQAVGREVFDTCFVAGRFVEAWSVNRFHGGDKARVVTLINRSQVKVAICGTVTKINDGNIRVALIDRWGGQAKAIGTKPTGYGPLHGIASHAWAALAVAVTRADQIRAESAKPG